MHLIVFLDFSVSNPDGAETGRLSGHHVDTVTEISRERCDSWTCEFEDLVLHETVLEHCLHE